MLDKAYTNGWVEVGVRDQLKMGLGLVTLNEKLEALKYCKNFAL